MRDGKSVGLNLNGRKMKIWVVNGIILLVNGMVMLMIKVFKQAKIIGFTRFQPSSLSLVIRIKHLSFNSLLSMNRNLIVVVVT